MNRQAIPLSDEAAQFAKLLGAAELVIFDFDGVIADSEVISLATLRDALGRFGLQLSAEETRARFLGTSLKTITNFVRAQGFCDANAFPAVWETILFARFETELKPVRQVFDVLEGFDQAGLRYCVASSGTFQRINTALRAMGRAGRFDHVFSAEQVAQGKPAPDLFQLAAQDLGVRPDACLVIEDSPHGVTAAKAAGMPCAGFVGGEHLADLKASHRKMLRGAGADMVLSSFAQVARLNLANRAIPQ